MIILDATDKSLQVLLAGAITTNQLVYNAAWVDIEATAFTPGASDGLTNSTTAVTPVAAPGASTSRQVKALSVFNNDTVDATVIVRVNNSVTFRILIKITLAINETLTWFDGVGWRVLDVNGNTKTSATGGSSSVDWGDINGTLSDQTDLQDELDAKEDSLGFTAENVANKDTDGALTANSDVKYASQKATKTYADTKLPLAGGTMSGNITLGENTSVALDPAGSADGKYSGITVTGIAGYTQAFGDCVYLDPTDSRWEACDANAAAGADGDSRGIIGMVVSAGTDGNACTILLTGIIRADANFPSFTVNNPIYVSETAGAVTQTQPTTTDAVIRVLGFALTADEMFFNPSPDYITHT